MTTGETMLVDHNLVPGYEFGAIRYEERPLVLPDGSVAEGLHNVWIVLDNPRQYNSYTTQMVKDVILAFRKASNDRRCVAVVFTGAGDKAFCTGGNTKEYAEYYSSRTLEYRQYMRLFNDMVSGIMACDKPVICRANGMRVGGGQEIGMACDFTVASDLAMFSQAGPKHGSVPDGGSTDFLPVYVGIERAMYSITLCEPWSAHKAMRLGMITDVVPALTIDDEWVPNPLVITDRYLDAFGHIVHGEYKEGAEKAAGKAMLARGKVDLSLLDAKVDELAGKIALTMPDCLTKALESMRKHKLVHWDRNRESNRAWLALNMMTEANAGFRAFNDGPREAREVDFLEVRRRLADGQRWSEDLVHAVNPHIRPRT
jgi:6-oxo-cyclohex-1-ene-carbonyl-CoA hydrolase